MENETGDEGQADNGTLQQNGSEGSPEPAGKTVTISGKSFVVNDDVAQAISEFTHSVDRRFDERSQELGALRQFKADVLEREKHAQGAANKQETPDYGTLMYENPNAFVDTIEDKIKREADKLRAEYQQSRAAEKEEANFWNSMWSENQDLARIKAHATDVIKLVGQKYADSPNTQQVRNMIARETREWMKGIVGTGNSFDSEGYVEGSSVTPVQAKPKKKEEYRRRTTKELLEGRRKEKMSAMMGLKK